MFLGGSVLIFKIVCFSFHRCTDENGFQFPATLAENGRNGFQFPSLYRRKQFSVSCEVGRERRKRFSVSAVVQTETVFSFLQGRLRMAERVFSFRCCTDGNGFQFLASLAENGRNGFQFPNDLSKIMWCQRGRTYCSLEKCTDTFFPSKCTGTFWNHEEWENLSLNHE